jgi:hypothetical protein
VPTPRKCQPPYALALLNIVDAFNLNIVWPMLPFMVGRCALTPPDPQLKGAWYPGGFNPAPIK